MEYPVFRNSGRVRHNRYPLLQAEVIPEDLGTEPSPLVIGASEQFLEQVMPEAGLSFYDALEPRQFEGKHGRAVSKAIRSSSPAVPPGSRSASTANGSPVWPDTAASRSPAGRAQDACG